MTIDTPYVGQGVATGSAVVLHGVKVGEVTTVSSLSGGGVRIGVDLQPEPAKGLTNAMTFDFRSVNYFGVTGINVIPNQGGRPLRNGMRLKSAPKGNFTLQALISRLGEISGGVLTPQLIQVVDRATRYVDGLNSLIETMTISIQAVDAVQTVRTAQLLSNTTEVADPFPGFVDSLSETGHRYIHPDDISAYHTSIQQLSDKGFERERLILKYAAENVFGDAGKLLSGNVPDLLPLIDSIRPLTDVVPGLIQPEGVAHMLTEARNRLEQMYQGTPEQRALRVRVVLDGLPGVAAPLGMAGGQ
ncbi:MlaD family protein [Mycobacterium arosiense]|uniref:MlaD family protein n=1 Tax=Mycobacterium arosiense TaxID=425468 RepID=UPI001FEC16E5|nr:MlaD family protein [Mycobacterium arosiense]